MKAFFTRTVNPSHILFEKQEARLKYLGAPIEQKAKEKAQLEKERLEKYEHEVLVKDTLK